jgi:hypothetical protein
MERQIEDINEKGSDLENPSTLSNQNAPTNAIQDITVSRAFRQHGKEQTTTNHWHQYCQLQGMLEDAQVMLWQASKKGSAATLKTAVNYINRIITLLPYFHGAEGYKWYHVKSPRGEGTISLADISVNLSQAVDAIIRGDNNSSVGLIGNSRDLLADLIEAEGGISK